MAIKWLDSIGRMEGRQTNLKLLGNPSLRKGRVEEILVKEGVSDNKIKYDETYVLDMSRGDDVLTLCKLLGETIKTNYQINLLKRSLAQ